MSDTGVQAEPPEPPRPRKSRDIRRERDDDDEDDYPRRRPQGPSAVESIIPFRNPKGLIAYYLGVFSLIPLLGLLLGPAALILGILGLRTSMGNPNARGGGHAVAGIVLGSITTLLNLGCLAFFIYGAASVR